MGVVPKTGPNIRLRATPDAALCIEAIRAPNSLRFPMAEPLAAKLNI
ncbi:MAG: hypothetical protein ABR953_07230 [Candidatus Acidiferrales bacterium]|jgi:hypothetical protein